MRRIPLLDLGNVILKVDFSEFLQWIERNSEVKDANRIQAFLSSSLVFDYEFGNIGRQEFIARTATLFRGNYPLEEFEHEYCNIFPGAMEGMEEGIEKLLSQGPVYCLTNTNELHFSYACANYPILRRLTRIFASHEMHRRKPYPGIYRDVARALDLHPRELVFFDDLSANVSGAHRAGLEAYVFEGAEQLLRIMKQPEQAAEESYA